MNNSLSSLTRHLTSNCAYNHFFIGYVHGYTKGRQHLQTKQWDDGESDRLARDAALTYGKLRGEKEGFAAKKHFEAGFEMAYTDAKDDKDIKKSISGVKVRVRASCIACTYAEQIKQGGAA